MVVRPSSSLTNTHCCQTSVSTGTSPFLDRSKWQTSGKVGRPLERAVEPVGPSVVRAPQHLRGALGFGDDGRGVVAADIEKAAQDAVISSDHHYRITGRHFG